jgi:hypothetical protein
MILFAKTKILLSSWIKKSTTKIKNLTELKYYLIVLQTHFHNHATDKHKFIP